MNVNLNTEATKMQSNKERNKAFDAGMQKIRPKRPVYDFSGIQAVIKQWVKGRE